jgi:type IV pilus assembly protein PilE
LAPQKIRSGAFTLLEVVIALALIGTLLTIAIPSYQRYVQRTHRADAIRLILATADCQSRIKAQTGFFDTTHCAPDPDEARYAFSFQPASQALADHYTVIATPLGEDDQCGALGLDHTGTRSISNPDGSVSKCWGGR